MSIWLKKEFRKPGNRKALVPFCNNLHLRHSSLAVWFRNTHIRLGICMQCTTTLETNNKTQYMKQGKFRFISAVLLKFRDFSVVTPCFWYLDDCVISVTQNGTLEMIQTYK